MLPPTVRANAETWHLNPLPAHPNGMTFTVFDAEGNMLATNQYFSIGGGFVVNNQTQLSDNMYYRREEGGAHGQASRREKTATRAEGSGREIVEKDNKAGPGTEITGRPPYIYATAEELHNICVEHNLTIAQVVWENERAFRTEAEIEEGLLHRE